MLKIVFVIVWLIAAVSPAHAEPISAIIAVISSIGASIGATVTALGTAALGVGAWSSLTAFLASPIGSLIAGIGISLVSSLFVQKQKKQQTPTVEAGKVNVRLAEPERWLVAGEMRQGGGVLFAEFDGAGNFWYIIVHADSELTGIVKIYMDDISIELNDIDHYVQTDDFCLDTQYNAYSSGGLYAKAPQIRLWTTTHSSDNPIPPSIAEFRAAFPVLWTDDHLLVGTTYSVICMSSIPPEHRYKIYRWRGSCGVGEPSVAVVGRWTKIYDPRDPTQILGNLATYKYSRNSALIWAWFRTHRYGRGKSIDSINWAQIAIQADICDQVVTGISGTQPRYACGTAIPESKERAEAEQEILYSCDGQLVFDDDGKCWVRVGYFYEPEIILTRNKDIVGMESVEAQNGESETQGVIVRYIDPSAKYAAQPSAPWVNPLYYVPGETPKYLTIEALTIQNHNQAMRLAKSIGYRSQAPHKLLPTVGLRGLKARQHRIVNLQYDNTFSGYYEIVTPVEVDELGVFCGFGVTPVDEDRWNLLPGEEQSQPVFSDSVGSVTLALPTGILSSYANNRIEIRFDPSPRIDWRYAFQYLQITEDPETSPWADMLVKMDEQFAYSGTVILNTTYYIRWRTISSSAKSTDWVDPIITVGTAIIDLTGTPVTVGTVDDPYTSFTIVATGGQPDYLFVDLFSRLPPGITINIDTGEVSGTPTTPGTYPNITIRVQDQDGIVRNFPEFTITISP